MSKLFVRFAEAANANNIDEVYRRKLVILVLQRKLHDNTIDSAGTSIDRYLLDIAT